jgi:hypothetical protein
MEAVHNTVMGRLYLHVSRTISAYSSSSDHYVRIHVDSLLFAFVTFLLLGTEASPDSVRLTWWATFLGVSSTLLAAFQYLPQIVHTFRHKLVGALSIPMMLIQTPGAILMVTSIALR